MTEFMKWLRVELLRLRSFDWGLGSRTIHSLKDGVAKFSSHYSTRDLAAKLGISEDEILAIIEAPQVLHELEGKSFTISWKDGSISLTWLEEGISDWNNTFDEHYYEENGKFYKSARWIQKIIYLDGTERILSDTGGSRPTCISKEAFAEAAAWIRRHPV